ncbi:DUF5672 family protein [Desulfovibrio legallii]|uniref:DUF5672 domain-containing protein n=2 Tax=Desulfovibrio legallii TaxID=571438 RepID=A0A1G7J833_9BACT|nr:DUF5672 family protein [Desulfovibrio legallii]SDF20659.1 hypothetical protein SAMN05192586_102209 [Desulfovibrio legallii]
MKHKRIHSYPVIFTTKMPIFQSAVAIIAYTETPTQDELQSLRQCLTVLNRHPLFLVCPQSMAPDIYLAEAQKLGAHLNLAQFKNKYFTSVNTYNRLMLCSEFYRRFEAYEYILLYQLDAWVFYDALERWCAKGYSYIGAPFFNDRGELFPFAGNGGFSLRRIPDFIALLEGTLKPAHWNYAFMKIQLPAKTPFRAQIKQFLHRMEMGVCRLSSKIYCRFMYDHEDFIFSKAFSLAGKSRVPPPQQAAFFSFERRPNLLYTWTEKKLPFGCHAYKKYNSDFWQSHM